MEFEREQVINLVPVKDPFGGTVRVGILPLRKGIGIGIQGICGVSLLSNSEPKIHLASNRIQSKIHNVINTNFSIY